MIKQSFLLLLTPAIVMGSNNASIKGDTKKRPNIVFIIAVQFRSMEMGCYGGTGVETPHFDRLVREGVRFTKAISTSPICSLYCAMLFTGNHVKKSPVQPQLETFKTVLTSFINFQLNFTLDFPGSVFVLGKYPTLQKHEKHDLIRIS